MNRTTGKDLEILSSYLDGELSESEIKKIEKRLLSDDNLQDVLMSLQNTRTALRSTPIRRVPRSFAITEEMINRFFSLKWAASFRVVSVAASFLFVLVFAGDLLGVGPGLEASQIAAPPAAESELMEGGDSNFEPESFNEKIDEPPLPSQGVNNEVEESVVNEMDQGAGAANEEDAASFEEADSEGEFEEDVENGDLNVEEELGIMEEPDGVEDAQGQGEVEDSTIIQEEPIQIHQDKMVLKNWLKTAEIGLGIVAIISASLGMYLKRKGLK